MTYMQFIQTYRLCYQVYAPPRGWIYHLIIYHLMLQIWYSLDFQNRIKQFLSASIHFDLILKFTRTWWPCYLKVQLFLHFHLCYHTCAYPRLSISTFPILLLRSVTRCDFTESLPRHSFQSLESTGWYTFARLGTRCIMWYVLCDTFNPACIPLFCQ